MYALFSHAFKIVVVEEEEDNIVITYLKKKKKKREANGNIFLELNERFETLREKDKPLVSTEQEVFSKSIEQLFNRK